MPTLRRAVAIALAVCGFIAIIAPLAAQADEWTINSVDLEELGGEEEVSRSGGPLELSVPSLGITIICESVGGKSTIHEGGTGEGTLSLAGCSVAEVPTCTVEPIVSEVITEITESEGVTYLLLTPATGETLAVITITGEECPLPPETALKGALPAEIGRRGYEQVEYEEKFSRKFEETIKISPTFGKLPAYLIGVVRDTLGGPNIGKPFAAGSWMKSNPASPGFGPVEFPNATTETVSFIYTDAGTTNPLLKPTIVNDAKHDNFFIKEEVKGALCNGAELKKEQSCKLVVEFKPNKEEKGNTTVYATITVAESDQEFSGRTFALRVSGEIK